MTQGCSQEKATSNKTSALMKSMKIDIWVVGTSNASATMLKVWQ